MRDINIISSNDWKVTNWSGGTTSELLILPEESDFKKGNYSLRISIATVEVEKSTFTPLPGVNRILTILNGELELFHEGQHAAKLNQYEQDSFLGDWKTTSIGKVRDFNVMTKDCVADVNVIELTQNEIIKLQKEDFLFIAEGEIKSQHTLLGNNGSLYCNEDTELVSTRFTIVIQVRIKK